MLGGTFGLSGAGMALGFILVPNFNELVRVT